MAKSFETGIYSSDRTIYEGKVISMVVPIESGFLGILADHAPLIAKLSPGKVTIRTAQGNTSSISLSQGGFLEILRNQVTLLLSQ